MATITAIEIQKRRPDRVNIDLDGDFAFSVTGMLATGLQVGQHLDPRQVAALQARDTDESAYQHALRFLGIRDRSEAELRTYLRRRKLPDDVLERTLARLREHQHADDARFASAWVENRSTFRPRGRRALTWELRQKGVSAEVVDTALADLDETALAYQAGIKKARQLVSAPWQDFRLRVSAYLARRGFEPSIVTTTVSRLWTEMHAGQPSLNEEDIP
jgi:regulatory protein